MNRASIRFSAFLLAVAACSGTTSWAESDAFRYVAPTEPPAGFTPKVHWLPLTTSPPAILLGGPPPTTGTRRYALLRYGTLDSTQVVLVLDKQDDGAVQLHVDRRRTGQVRDDDAVALEQDRWRLPIDSHIPRTNELPEAFSREIEVRTSTTGDAIGVATIGFMEGSVTLDSTPVGARRVDANGNGLFADSQDRLWLDLDANGKWDPFAEQFPFAPILKVAGKRFAVRSDQAGQRLAFEEITGSGALRIQLATLAPGFAVRELDVALMGDDGSAYAASADGELVEVPEGRYAVRSLRVVLLDELWQREWRFVFMRRSDPQPENWHEVSTGQTVTIDPVGKLLMKIEGDELARPVAPGRQITVEPRLYTQDGLWINACDIAGAAPTSPLVDGQKAGADVELCLDGGKIASSYRSGFA
jgi:hypothetical protein